MLLVCVSRGVQVYDYPLPIDIVLSLSRHAVLYLHYHSCLSSCGLDIKCLSKAPVFEYPLPQLLVMLREVRETLGGGVWG